MAIFFYICCGAASLLLLFPCLCVLRIFTGKSLGSKAYPPVKGTIFHFLRCLDSFYDYQAEIATHDKTFRYLAFSQSEVYTADPQNIEYILKTNFANYDKGEYHQEITKDLLGEGIFAVDGQKWRHQRKVASYEFSTKVLRDFSSVIFRRNAAVLAQKISDNAEADLPMDMHELFTQYSMDSIFEVGFGVKLNILDGTNKEAITFTKAFDESNALTFHRYVNLFWKVKRFLNVGTEATLRKNIAVIDEFINKIISFRRKKYSCHQSSSVSINLWTFLLELNCVKEDILSRFLLESEKNPETLNDRYLRDIILNFMFAGKDTTGGTLSWFIYLLSKHPLIQEKIAQEVKEIVGSCEKGQFTQFVQKLTEGALEKLQYLHAALSETLRLYPAVPIHPLIQEKIAQEVKEIADSCEKGQFTQFVERLTEGALENLQYLHAALSETLRLYPAIPFDRRYACKDDVLPDGFKVKKGDGVSHVTYAMGRMKYIWGDDAEDFRPGRWLHDGVFRPESPLKFPAFHASRVLYTIVYGTYVSSRMFCCVIYTHNN
ncbi:Cytochrome P450 4g1 [Nymphaea thermarum]|nr:Cytochrome P450 4g1 [Nymphaea thermarum]